jgi:hypothetical protein
MAQYYFYLYNNIYIYDILNKKTWDSGKHTVIFFKKSENSLKLGHFSTILAIFLEFFFRENFMGLWQINEIKFKKSKKFIKIAKFDKILRFFSENFSSLDLE